jgi:hypothetical protein
LTVLCAVFIGFTTALSVRHAAADVGLADKRYVDPKGYFEIVPPADWEVQEYPEDPRGKVAFVVPGKNVDLRVLVNAVDFSTFDELKAWCRATEGRIGLDTHIKETTLGGRPAIERSFEAQGIKFYYIDFIDGQVDHNLAFGAPPSAFEHYRQVALASMATYEPVPKSLTDAQTRQHFVAKKRRLAELMLENGHLSLASEYVADGLRASPDDPALLALKERIESNESVRGASATASDSADMANLEESASGTTAVAQGVQEDIPTEDSGGGASAVFGALLGVPLYVLFFKRLFGSGRRKESEGQ